MPCILLRHALASALFGCIHITTAQYPDDEAALEEALDALLDNPDFLDLVADEVMFQVGGQPLVGVQLPGMGLAAALWQEWGWCWAPSVEQSRRQLSNGA